MLDAAPPPAAPGTSPERRGRRRRWTPEALALVLGAVLLLAAFLAEPLGVWADVRQWIPPLSARWQPNLGPGLPVAVVVAAAVTAHGPRLAAVLPWRRVLVATWVAQVLWGLALALVRGFSEGVRAPLAHPHEYLSDVDRVVVSLDGVGQLLRTYVDSIPLDAPDNWHTHNSGHPPVPLLAYAVLARVGLGGPVVSGLVTALVGSTAVLAVLVVLRTVGDERHARAAAPYVALSPLVIWVWISADGAFAAVAAWGLALLALAATTGRRRDRLALSVAAGAVLGLCCFLSYGLVLLGPLALAVLFAAGTWRPLVPAVLTALGVVALFAAGGFWWLEAQQVLVERYYDGAGGLRPYSYWVWANLAVAVLTVGPAVTAGAGAAVLRRRGRRTGDGATGRAGRVGRLGGTGAAWLAAGAVVALLAATASGLSKSEVERIWLPFTVWLVPLAAWLPRDRAPRWLAAQAAWALVIAVLLRTTW